MAYYLVRARLKPDVADELHERLKNEEFKNMQPFGRALTYSLENARFDPSTGEAVWEEEDYCTPPLAMERDAVLDNYFEGLTHERVSKGEGWEEIEDLPSLWERKDEIKV